MDYAPRLMDGELDLMLEAAGAVLIEGPRACGKTATARHRAASAVYLDADDAALAMVATTPRLVLDGATPRLLDEWQLAPRIWNHVRRAVDERRERGQFILTGSATPSDDATRHSGAGRIIRLRMRPMSLYESRSPATAVSLADLMSGGVVNAQRTDTTVEDMAALIVGGGWPESQGEAPEVSQRRLRSYLDDIARVDLPAVPGEVARRDPARISRTLRAYARHTATSASNATIAADTAGAEGSQIYVDTVRGYVSALERIWIVEEQPSWGVHLRSKDVVRKAAVRHFVDPSLAAAALGAGPDRLLRDPETLGLLFESLVVRDLRIYSQVHDGEVLHYRDSAGAEADAVIQLRDGRWALVEVKLAGSRVDEAAASLTRLAAKIDTSRIGAPSALIVITAGEYAYTRDDGIHVVPLACLGP